MQIRLHLFYLVVLSFTLLTVNLKAEIAIIKGQSVKTDTEYLYNVKESKKPTIVIFISKDCPCSNANISYINNLKKEFPEYKFIAIHALKNSTVASLNEYLKTIQIDLDVINDTKLEMTNLFAALKTPHAFIVNNDGEIIYNGGITNTTNPENAREHFLKNALNELKNNRPITKKETKTLGCVIVR